MMRCLILVVVFFVFGSGVFAEIIVIGPPDDGYRRQEPKVYRLDKGIIVIPAQKYRQDFFAPGGYYGGYYFGYYPFFYYPGWYASPRMHLPYFFLFYPHPYRFYWWAW